MSVVPIGLLEPANANSATKTLFIVYVFSTASEKKTPNFFYITDDELTFRTFWQSHWGEKQLNSSINISDLS